MLRDKKIAAFIDVENAALDNESYLKVMEQIGAMGEIVCASIYGASERKHKMVIEDAREHGYSVLLSAKGRRRGRKSFDERIYVDVAALIARNNLVDAVAVISAPADMVYLFSHIRRTGMQVIAIGNLDDQSAALVSDRVEIPQLAQKAAKKPVQRPAQKPVQKPAPVKEEPKPAEDDKTEEILRQIERLREDLKHEEELEAARKEESKNEISDETRQLLEKIAAMQQQQPAQADDSAPRAVYISQNDSDLIRRIEELRKANEGHEEDDFIKDVKKLLDGWEDEE